jgi:hypothetical protein
MPAISATGTLVHAHLAAAVLATVVCKQVVYWQQEQSRSQAASPNDGLLHILLFYSSIVLALATGCPWAPTG